MASLFRSRVPFRIAAIAGMLVMTGGLAPNTHAGRGAAPRYGGTIHYRDDAVPDCLDPQKTALGASHAIFEEVVDTLVTQDEKGKLRPSLALMWKLSNGGKVITFNLRHGVRFSNGHSLTASDVQATFLRALNPATKSPDTFGFLGPMKTVKVIDPYTVQLIMKTPYRPLMTNLAIGYEGILDVKAMNAEGTAQGCQYPVGSGPYKVQSVAPGFSSVTLVRNPYHSWETAWAHNQGKPYLDQVTWTPILSDATAVSALLSGSIDITAVPGPQLSRIKGNSSIKQHKIYTQGEVYLGFNTSHPPFDKVAVRKAISEAINRSDIITAVLQGLGMPAFSPIPQTLPYYDKTAPTYSSKYNPTAAHKILSAPSPCADVEVRLRAQLARYELPAPPSGQSQVDAIRSSLDILELVPDPVAVPVLGLLYRAPLGCVDFAVHLFGHTGTGKTAIAALAQQHMGSTMDAQHLPGSWESTDNALEALLHMAGDAVCVVDDFMYKGSQADVQRLNRVADRIFRELGNQTGRARMRADLTMVAPKVPHAALLSTGEECPRGQSLTARRVDVEVQDGDVAWSRLTECQRDGHEGLYAAAMSGYITWLAPQYNNISSALSDRVKELREQILVDGQHKRTPHNLAQLAVGWSYFLDYAVEAGAIDTAQRCDLDRRIGAALAETARTQTVQQAEHDSIARFLETIRAAIASGDAHIATLEGTMPSDARSWGWRDQWTPQGKLIGWVEGNDVYLLPDAALQIVQRWGESAGEPLHISKRMLGKGLKARGLLASYDKGRGKNTTRKVVKKARHDVYHLRAETFLLGESAHAAPSAQERHEPRPVRSRADQDGGRFGGPQGDLDPQHRPTAATAISDEAALPPQPRSNGPIGSTPGGRTTATVHELYPDGVPNGACMDDSHARAWTDTTCHICHPPPATPEHAA
jgi:hypothetical protein